MSKSHQTCEHRYIVGVFKDGKPDEWDAFPDEIVEIAGCSETQAFCRDFHLRNERVEFDIARTDIDHFAEWMRKNGVEVREEPTIPSPLADLLAQATQIVVMDEFLPSAEEHDAFHKETGLEVGSSDCSVCAGMLPLRDQPAEGDEG